MVDNPSNVMRSIYKRFANECFWSRVESAHWNCSNCQSKYGKSCGRKSHCQSCILNEHNYDIEYISDHEPGKCGAGCASWTSMVPVDRKLTLKMVERAEKAGFEALVLTVDTPVVGKRRDDLRNGFSLPNHLKMANFPERQEESTGMKAAVGKAGFNEYAKKLFESGLTWFDVKWLVNNTKLPVIVKGILSPKDASLAVKHGVQGIIVSNHGARQLDCVPATIECVAGIVNAVGNVFPVFLDGGVRTGTDIFKALALGAKAVFIGRPVLWGLTVRGEDGIKEILEMFRDELDTTMALAGCQKIEDISAEFIHHERDLLSKL